MSHREYENLTLRHLFKHNICVNNAIFESRMKPWNIDLILFYVVIYDPYIKVFSGEISLQFLDLDRNKIYYVLSLFCIYICKSTNFRNDWNRIR